MVRVHAEARLPNDRLIGEHTPKGDTFISASQLDERHRARGTLATPPRGVYAVTIYMEILAPIRSEFKPR